MKTEQELSLDVLACANKVARMSLSMPPDGDLPLEAFNFDSHAALNSMMLCSITNAFAVSARQLRS